MISSKTKVAFSTTGVTTLQDEAEAITRVAKIAFSTTGVTTLQDEAETIFFDAIKQTEIKFGLSRQHATIEDLFSRYELFDNLKYNIAKGVANTLAANDKQVLAVYFTEPSMNADAESGEYPPIDVNIHLLILVKTPSAALKTLIASLDKPLVQHLKSKFDLFPAQCNSVLDVMLLTEEEVENNTGYANLLRSIFSPPLKIWQRDS